MLFLDRTDAGRKLAERLRGHLSPMERSLVLGLPRGGVPVAYEVARSLPAPLDVLIVRKLGVPGHEELAMGAIASGGVRTLNADVIRQIGVPDGVIEKVTEREMRELRRREQLYRGDRAPLEVSNRTVIVIDDGLATGASMRAALEALAEHRPRRLIAAVPVAPGETCLSLQEVADDVVCAETPQPFLGVGRWYANFTQTTDDEVRQLILAARGRRGDDDVREVAHG